MAKTLSKNLIRAGLTFFLFLVSFLPVLAQTEGNSSYDFKEKSGLGITANVAGFVTGTDASSVDSVISRIILILLSFVGVLFFALVIYGAFTWMTAGGNAEQAKKANGLVMTALIGLIITLSAYVISYFLISYFW